MIKYFSSILFCSLFLLMQYGKISNYLFCEWQAKIVWALPDCDCQPVLDGVFDHEPTDSYSIQQSKDKIADYIPCSPDYRIVKLNQITSSLIAFYPQQLPDGNLKSAFHPPAF